MSDSSCFLTVDAYFCEDAVLASALVGLVAAVAFLSLVTALVFDVDTVGAVAAGFVTLEVSLLVAVFYWLVACCLL